MTGQGDDYVRQPVPPEKDGLTLKGHVEDTRSEGGGYRRRTFEEKKSMQLGLKKETGVALEELTTAGRDVFQKGGKRETWERAWGEEAIKMGWKKKSAHLASRICYEQLGGDVLSKVQKLD